MKKKEREVKTSPFFVNKCDMCIITYKNKYLSFILNFLEKVKKII